MRKVLGILTALFLLAGCSMHTRYTLDLKLEGFLGDLVQGSVDLPAYASFEVYLPDDDDGDLTTPDLDGAPVQVPALSGTIEQASLRIEAQITETGGETLELNAVLYVGDANAADLYHGDGVQVGSASLNLNANETGNLVIDVALREGDPGYDLVASGDFRLGIQLSGSAKAFKYEVTALDLSLTTPPLGELLR